MSFCFSRNHPNPEIGGDVPVSIDEMKQQEEEQMRKSEEMRTRLDEVLDFQRKIENEAKQKRLAEQNKSSGGTSAENAIEGVPAVSSEAGNPVVGSSEQQQPRQSGPLINFGTFNWTDFHGADQSDKSEKKSSEFEAPEN